MVRIIPTVFLLSLAVQAQATVTPYPSMARLPIPNCGPQCRNSPGEKCNPNERRE